MIDPFFVARPLVVSNPPKPASNWAVFLDLDGTLLDIATAPDRVNVPMDLVRDLATASAALDGALAIVSGRMLSEIDRLLSPLRLPAGGEHGAIIRLPSGQYDEVDSRVPIEWTETLEAAVAKERGVFVERKSHTVVVHYRRAPRREDFCRQLCVTLIEGFETEFEVLAGKMAFEIRPRSITKARPVERLMNVEPFRGRRPVFVGDDVTDEDGFRAAAKLGGEGLDVLLRFGGSPGEVRAWLKTFGEFQASTA